MQGSPSYTSNRLTHRDSALCTGLKTDKYESHISPGILNYENTDIKYTVRLLRAPYSDPMILIFTDPSGIYEIPLSCKYANIPPQLAAGHKCEPAAFRRR